MNIIYRTSVLYAAGNLAGAVAERAGFARFARGFLDAVDPSRPRPSLEREDSEAPSARERFMSQLTAALPIFVEVYRSVRLLATDVPLPTSPAAAQSPASPGARGNYYMIPPTPPADPAVAADAPTRRKRKDGENGNSKAAETRPATDRELDDLS